MWVRATCLGQGKKEKGRTQVLCGRKPYKLKQKRIFVATYIAITWYKMLWSKRVAASVAQEEYVLLFAMLTTMKTLENKFIYMLYCAASLATGLTTAQQNCKTSIRQNFVVLQDL